MLPELKASLTENLYETIRERCVRELRSKESDIALLSLISILPQLGQLSCELRDDVLTRCLTNFSTFELETKISYIKKYIDALEENMKRYGGTISPVCADLLATMLLAFHASLEHVRLAAPDVFNQKMVIFVNSFIPALKMHFYSSEHAKSIYIFA